MRVPYIAILVAVAACNASGAENGTQPSEDAFFESDDIRIHYTIHGEGPPLVLVHGWGADGNSNWIDPGWVEALAPHRKLILPDIRGHGLSDKPHDQALYSYAAMSRDVIALLDHLEIERAEYMGYSMGAFMGAWLLGHHPERFNAMVLGGIGDETPESANACIAIAEALRASDPSKITSHLGRAYRAYADANPNSDREALAASALQMWPEGYPLKLGGEGLSRVNIPVLIVNGSRDLPYVLTGDRLAAAIPGARHVQIEGADHLTAIPHPRFREIVLEFLAESTESR